MWTFLAHGVVINLLRRALGFSVLQFWLFFRSFFRFLCQKISVFRFWCLLRFADFSFLSIWFSVFVKNTSSFTVLVSDVVFGFSYFVLFRSRFLFDLSGNLYHIIWLTSNSRETPKQTKCHGRWSRVSNDARDFDLPDQGDHSVSFQRASCACNGKSHCGLCCVFLWGGERRIFLRFQMTFFLRFRGFYYTPIPPSFSPYCREIIIDINLP